LPDGQVFFILVLTLRHLLVDFTNNLFVVIITVDA